MPRATTSSRRCAGSVRRRSERLDDAKVSSSAFRGAASKDGYKSGFDVTRKHGFTQYRGGLMDEKGRVSDLTKVVAHTPAWEARLARVEQGLQAVYRGLKPGAKVADLDKLFMTYLDPEEDAAYGSVVAPHGIREPRGCDSSDTVDKYDFLTVGAAVGDGKETALVYRNAVGLEEHEPMFGRLPEGTYGATMAEVRSPLRAQSQKK